jgi:3-O-methylgallate 3,4-dioxygenase
MAELVFAAGSSHSPALNSSSEEQLLHAEVDQGMPSWPRQLVDRDGNPCTYEELLAKAPEGLAAQIAPDVLEQRVAACQAHMDRLEADIEAAELDALIVIGDDQKEQYLDDNMPALLVYWGDTIRNDVLDLPEESPDFWKKARGLYHEQEARRDYPVASDLALHIIHHLIGRDFDVAQARELRFARGEGHAFGFVHRRLMRKRIVPIVPVALNTYFPPNQPRPARCHQLGEELARAVAAWESDARVGIIASGGLSHFTIDEELDRGVLDAFCAHDGEALSSVPAHKLRAGNSEIRNWITVGGAARGLEVKWREYVPCYRSLAGTGCAMGFVAMGPAAG